MAKVKCPVCNGEGIEPVRCGRLFDCPCCQGEGEIEESLLAQKGIPAISHDQMKEGDSKKLPAPDWMPKIAPRKAK
jgi:hypothetical protein